MVQDSDETVDSVASVRPIRVTGALRVSLLGLSIARIDLDLTIATVDRFVGFVRRRFAPDPPDLSALTRDELYDRARRADVRGRSQMTKEELLSALSD